MKQAAIQMTVVIDFEDNGEDDLKELATEQLMMEAPSDWNDTIEVEKIMIEPEAKG